MNPSDCPRDLCRLAALLCLATPSLLCQGATSAFPSIPCPQQPAGLTSQFEVATIKPSGLSGLIGLYTYPGGKLYAGNATVADLVQDAFALPGFQIKGATAWMTTAAYDVTALPPETSPARRLNPISPKAPPTPEQRRMLQSLLADRFGLTVHCESRPGPIFVLERSKTKLGLVPSRDATRLPYVNVLVTSTGVGNGEMIGENTTLSFVAERLTSMLGRPVSDHTGLSGAFDFHIEAPEPANADQTDAILSGLSRLGLKLRPTRGNVPTLIVDHAHPPTEN